ncbi:hypothetical protein GWI33_015420 [Rhynchophorus ferrugineus]|uniref:S-adenosylmethionine sensor upstream of mTORC1 n=1 Tax=Rhynchophorus ferrugineus TaxID=354439 RepID=A0A834HZB9_RHYFE|nr:hypothetical protein GWI33_015420 [Rhynchophorus ferrugineus]
MASNEKHKILSDIIKSTHKKLRDESKLFGMEEAWRNHCLDEDHLKKYASAMHDLAVNHWEQNSLKDEKVVSRITWIYESISKYFDYFDKYHLAEIKMLETLSSLDEAPTDIEPVPTKLKLLDVGSCYNPFQKFDKFDVIALDIAPANNGVFKCDFLNVPITEKSVTDNGVVSELQKHSFHVVVFSLFLEYLPCPDLRLSCCIKAYGLLKPEGILVIVTPDSNHVGSNVKIFKSWRYSLSLVGFNRIQYQKLPHMHCMVFRKNLSKELAKRWAKIHQGKGLYDKIYIPQDFNKTPETIEYVCQDSTGWCEETFLRDFELND